MPVEPSTAHRRCSRDSGCSGRRTAPPGWVFRLRASHCWLTQRARSRRRRAAGGRATSRSGADQFRGECGRRRGDAPGVADVVVTDGFTGNAVLKAIEGTVDLRRHPARRRAAVGGRCHCCASARATIGRTDRRSGWCRRRRPRSGRSTRTRRLRSARRCRRARRGRTGVTGRSLSWGAARIGDQPMRSQRAPSRAAVLDPGGESRDRGRSGNPRAGAHASLVRVRERRLADQRATGIPRRFGAGACGHRRALSRPSRRCPEGQLAKLRAAVVNMRALANVARGLDLGQLPAAGSWRGGHRRTRQGLDPRRHGRGADRRRVRRLWTRCGLGARSPALRRVDRAFRAARRGTGLEDQPAGADGGRPPSAYRSTSSQESGPDHRKQFTAIVRVNGADYGDGHGRSKKEAEQQAAESAWTAIRATVGGADRVADATAATVTDEAAKRAEQVVNAGADAASRQLMPELAGGRGRPSRP